jgi:replicative DNA helicase
VLDKAEKRIFEIAQRKVGNAMVPMETVLHEVFEMIENRGQRGVETGFYELDDMMNGLQNGEMVIVAARPSMGKAQPLDAQVLTRRGFKPMGEVRVGDELASVDGAPSHVVGVFPQGRRQVYRSRSPTAGRPSAAPSTSGGSTTGSGPSRGSCRRRS